jgi:hypothetical protein
MVPGPLEARPVCLKQLGRGLKVVAVLAPRPVLSKVAVSHDRPPAFPSIFPSMSASMARSTPKMCARYFPKADHALHLRSRFGIVLSFNDAPWSADLASHYSRKKSQNVTLGKRKRILQAKRKRGKRET